MKPHLEFDKEMLFLDAIESIRKTEPYDNKSDCRLGEFVGIRITMKSGRVLNEMWNSKSRMTLRNLRFNDIMNTKNNGI